jgi:hypothetical protein
MEWTNKIIFVFIAMLLNISKQSMTIVSFIPYFHLLVFWYFGHFSCVIFFSFFFRLAYLALQNVNKDYVIFSYFHNFVGKSDQKPTTLNGMNKTFV